MRLLRYSDVAFNILILLGATFNTGCMQFRSSDKKIIKQFQEYNQQAQIDRYKINGHTVRYISVGNDSLPTVLFIHGAPGSSNAFFGYMKDSTLLQKVRMVSVDRVGYGYSNFGKSETNIQKQAESLFPLVQKLKNNQPVLLAGHSYGGSIAARMAMDYPDQIQYLILAAPALDPDNEKMFWVNKPANWFIFKWAIPKAMRVSNDEKLAHKEEVKKMLPLWSNINMPVTYIHGKSDGIVPFANAVFAQKMLSHNPNTDFILEEKLGHLFVFNKPELLKNAILKYFK